MPDENFPAQPADPQSNPFAAPVASPGESTSFAGPDSAEIVITRAGIKTTYVGLALVMGGLAVIAIILLSDVANRGFDRPAGAAGPNLSSWMIIIPTLIYMLGYLVMFVGECMCVSAPKNAGKLSVSLAVLFQGISILMSICIVIVFPDMFRESPLAGDAERVLYLWMFAGVTGIAGMLWACSLFLYMRFVRLLNLYAGNERNARLAGSTRNVLIAVYFFSLAIVIGAIFVPLDGPRMAIVYGILGIVTLGFVIAGMLMFARLLHNTGRALDFGKPVRPAISDV